MSRFGVAPQLPVTATPQLQNIIGGQARFSGSAAAENKSQHSGDYRWSLGECGELYANSGILNWG